MLEQVYDRWTHPSVILVATDLSDLDRLMPFAFEQAAETGARLILLHALSTTEAMTVDAVGMPYYDPVSAQECAAHALQEWCGEAHLRGLRADALVREGHAAQQIAAAVRQFKADRVLVGTRSRGKIGKLLLGSVAEQVLRSVNLPVLTVGPEAHLPVAGAGAPGTVLYATTLREASRPSAALACHLAGGRNARLVLVHVLPPMEELERRGTQGLHQAAMYELEILAREIRGKGNTTIEPLVVHGNPAIEILAEASARKASLIVLGATHRSAFENLTRTRTIYRVLAHARCPVLTLSEKAGQENRLRTEQIATHR